VEVSDTGDGIAAEHLAHVTDRFYRVDASRTASSGGLGLGLAIVKSIVESHAGTLTIASEVGVGTTVRLRFPSRRS
jgi:signal transduction histidine kinase